MNKKIVCLGGGSRYFSRVLGDLAVTEGLAGSEITFYDIDYEKAEIMARHGARLAEESGTGLHMHACKELADAVDGADFAISSIGGAGTSVSSVYGTTMHIQDMLIPARYGIYQVVGDTAGPAGMMNVMDASRAADDLIQFQRREVVGTNERGSERLTPAGAPRPVTIRLMRNGDTFTGGWSLDGGATWEKCVTRDGVTPTPPVELAFTDPVLLGIAVTSHEAGVITTAEVELIGATAVDAAGKVAMTWGKIKSN